MKKLILRGVLLPGDPYKFISGQLFLSLYRSSSRFVIGLKSTQPTTTTSAKSIKVSIFYLIFALTEPNLSILPI